MKCDFSIVCRSLTMIYLRNHDADAFAPELSCHTRMQFSEPSDLDTVHRPSCMPGDYFCCSPRHRHDECIDATSLQDQPVWIGEGSYLCLIVVAVQDEGHFRSSARIHPPTSEDQELIEVAISRLIVDHRCHTQLGQSRGERGARMSVTFSRSFRSLRLAKMRSTMKRVTKVMMVK